MTRLFPRPFMKETCLSAHMAGMLFFGGQHVMAMV